VVVAVVVVVPRTAPQEQPVERMAAAEAEAVGRVTAQRRRSRWYGWRRWRRLWSLPYRKRLLVSSATGRGAPLGVDMSVTMQSAKFIAAEEQ
jgi:hypothetical protein